PDFNLMQTDSSWFIKANIPLGKPVVIIYFSPDCGHCQLSAHEYEEKIDQFSDVFFVWVSYLSLDKIKSFAEEYKMLGQENIRIGRDPSYFIPSFYRVKFTPFMAVYDAAGKLLKTYDEGTDPDTLTRLLHPAKS
ncbi:MAG: redoxin domain-containing protein, partial [Panacibacter sp.]